MKNVKVPNWLASTIIIGLVVGLVTTAYINRHGFSSRDEDCTTVVDSEHYNKNGTSKILIETEYCKKKNVYYRSIALPPGQSMLGRLARDTVNFKYKDKEKAAKRAPSIGLHWSEEGKLLIYHEQDAEYNYDAGEYPVMMIEYAAEGTDWDYKSRNSGQDQLFTKSSYDDGNLKNIEKNLKKIKAGDSIGVVYFDPTLSKEINQSLEGVYRVIETRLDRKSKKVYVIDFSEGMSMDPGFTFYKRTDKGLKTIGGFAGNKIYLPGNGAVYIVNEYNTTFKGKDKLILKDDKLKYVKQPFQYVGLTTQTTALVKLYSSLEIKEEVAVLPRGSEVSVLLAKGENYLVRTPFGLVGWVKIKRGYNSPIAGIYFAGD